MKCFVPGSFSTLAAVVALSALQVGAGAGGREEIDYQKTADGARWGWSLAKASPLYSARRAGDKYDIRLLNDHRDRAELTVEVWAGDDRVYSWVGHSHSVFRIQGDRLYYADFHPSSSGGEVVAVDLVAGKQLWKSRLRAIGPVAHSAYRNLMNLDANYDVVEVFGRESLGRYVEYKSTVTGQTVGHKVFPREEERNGEEEREGKNGDAPS